MRSKRRIFCKRTLTGKLSAVQTLIVMSGVAIGFGIGAIGYKLFVRARLETRLGAATARLQEEATKQRDVLVAAIEAYRQTLGCYPPDHVTCISPLTVDPITNQLFYELLGTFHSAADDTFDPPHYPEIRRSLFTRFFGTNCIKNSVERPEQLHHFLDITNMVAVYVIKTHPEPVGLIGIWPAWEGMAAALYQHIEPASWRYNSSAPTHNPGKFDLWIELKTTRTNILVKNW